MTKKFWMTLTAVIFVFSAVSVSFAAEGNKRKGKYTYRKVYTACHERGEAASAKPPINPDSKTQAQWTEVFEKKDFTEFGCKQEWDALSPEDIADIHAYLYEHASDSPTPAKCK